MLDVGCIVCYAVVSLVQWNAHQMHDELKKRFLSGPQRLGVNTLGYHMAVFKHFLTLMADLPYLVGVAIIGLSLWRLPTLIRFIRHRNNASIRRKQELQLADKREAVVETFCCLLLDLPALIAYLAVHITVWHAADMRQKLQASMADCVWANSRV